MAGLGWQELLIVLIIIVIIFGAGKLPEIGSALGRGVKEFKAEATDDSLPEGETAKGGTTATAANTSATSRKVDEVVIDRRELRADEI
jgi:sec-independent protein translocase protein TatA